MRRGVRLALHRELDPANTNDRPNDLNTFDNMDCACGTHPTAFTKVELGWLDESAIILDPLPEATYQLHTLGLVQPPPPGRVVAIKIASTGGNPLYVEARQKVDQYDGGTSSDYFDSSGIWSEGVIVYELAGVQNPNPWPGLIDPLIRLHTQTALTPGQTFTSDLGIAVTVTAALPGGGYGVKIVNPTAPAVVPDVIGLYPEQASQAVTSAGLLPKFAPVANGTWVRLQSPIGGNLAPRGSTVTMTQATSGHPER